MTRPRPAQALELLAFGLLLAAAAPLRAGDLKVTVVNVGQGDAIHIETPAGKHYLIDGGDTSDEDNPPELDDSTQDFCPIVRYLLERNIRTLDMMLRTGDDHDHYAGLDAILGTSTTVNGSNVFSVKTVVFTSNTVNLTNLSAAKHPETALVQVSSGTRLEELAALSGVWDPALQGLVLSPRDRTADPGDNSSSIVLKLVYGRVSFLLTGDAGNESPTRVEERMAADFPGQLAATILKVGHHGSRTSSSQAFVDAVRPETAIISCAQRDFGLPDQDVIARLEDAGARVLRTDRHGHVTVATNGVSYSVSTAFIAPADVSAVSAGPAVHAYPNPAPGRTSPAKATLVYDLNGLADDVRVAVYDAAGGLVRAWGGAPRVIGRNFLDWDLRNGEGDPVASGLYIVQVEAKAGGGSQVGRSKLAVVNP